jgi:hypothetical protein
MRSMNASICLVLATVAGCSQPPTPSPSVPQVEEHFSGWPKEWSRHLGQPVTLEGTAANAKLGAVLEGEKDMIWIADLDSWPNGFYPGAGKGKRLRVTGTVIKRDDMPVYIEKRDQSAKGGMPVHSEEELAREKSRFLLKDARWTVLE